MIQRHPRCAYRLSALCRYQIPPIPIPTVGHHNVTRLQAVVVKGLASTAVAQDHFTEAAGAKIVGQVHAPVVTRAPWGAEGRGIDQQDAARTGMRPR